LVPVFRLLIRLIMDGEEPLQNALLLLAIDGERESGVSRTTAVVPEEEGRRKAR
jgi:hypothetical protein